MTSISSHIKHSLPSLVLSNVLPSPWGLCTVTYQLQSLHRDQLTHVIYDRYVPDETFLLGNRGSMAKGEVMKKWHHQVLDESASPVNPEY